MKFNKASADMIEIELISADTAAFLNTANKHAIYMYNVNVIDFFCTHFWIKTSDFHLLRKISKKQGDQIRIIMHKGTCWQLKRGLRRPVILVGIFLFVILLSYAPSRVLFIQVEGNENLSAQEIISAAESCGIYFGASRKEVRSEKVKNTLLSQLPELQWAGVNTKGCVTLISVKERTEETQKGKGNISSIIASRDGIITSCVLENGNLLCTVGQAVQKGQLLISAFTDCGLSIRATQASGEITAKTNRKLSVIIPTESLIKDCITEQKKKISLLIGKKRINLWKGSGISDTTCDRIYKEYYVMLPGGYSIPFGISIDFCTAFQMNAHTIDLESASDSIVDYAKGYLHNQMVAGTIINGTESFAVSDEMICMTGEYVCTEMIGMVQPEQIGE